MRLCVCAPLGTLYKQAVCCCCQRWSNDALSIEEHDAHPRCQSSGNRLPDSAARRTQHLLAADSVDPRPIQIHAVKETSVRISASGNDVITCNNDSGGETL